MSKILVIDDELPMRKLLSTALSQIGHEVDCVSTGTHGLKCLAEKSYALLITDLFLPGQCGLAIIDKLRKEENKIKIIAISGGQLISKNTILEFASLKGADYCFQKPFDLHNLIDKVEELVK